MKTGNVIKWTLQKTLPKYIKYNFCSTFIPYSSQGEIFHRTMQYLNHHKMKGDYFEFGTAEGQSLVSAYHLARHHDLFSMNFYTFDSFEGLPKLKGLDKNGSFKPGDYAYSYEDFINFITRAKVDLNKVTAVQGWYKDTLNENTKKDLKSKKAALIFIDSDMYESAGLALNFMTDYIQNGTIIIFDDWFCNWGDPEMGERLAFRINILIFMRKYHWKGISFILLKR